MTRRHALFLIVLLAAVVNLPLLHSWYVDQKVRTSGTDVTATVVDDRVLNGDEYWLSFTFPEDVDPDQRTWTAEVDEEAYDDAVASQTIPVRVVEDDPAAYRAEGTVTSSVPLVMTLVADAILLLVALLLWRSGGRMRPRLRAVALEDVERCAPETLLDRIGGEDYLIRGEVLEIGEGSVTLDLGNRAVVVLLDGHQNSVGHQQPAQVRARLID
ncbi:hypothetical protein [Nocardioides aquiterrae]|uniref:DUF3592 domain-containing protein n=1 Tax=Nocardioides aquiterrae TaxID=203799 RepID=A0ABP4ETR7_9ACTN